MNNADTFVFQFIESPPFSLSKGSIAKADGYKVLVHEILSVDFGSNKVQIKAVCSHYPKK